MNVTYNDIRKGYTLLVNDVLQIHGFQHKVVVCSGYYYLYALGLTRNDAVFKRFGMTDSEKMNWAVLYGECIEGPFPEFKLLTNLTRFVQAIYERSPYKLGDFVKIRHRVEGYTYPFGFVDGMAMHAGYIFRIQEIRENQALGSDDPHGYLLTAPGGFLWHSSMFEPVKGEKLVCKAFSESKGVNVAFQPKELPDVEPHGVEPHEEGDCPEHKEGNIIINEPIPIQTLIKL